MHPHSVDSNEHPSDVKMKTEQKLFSYGASI